MGKNVQHVQHVKSNVVENGSPKLPNPSVLAEGEIAINFAEGYETLSIKSSSGNIKTFSSDEYYTKQKLGSAFTDENSAVTVTDIISEVEVSSGVVPTNESVELWIDTGVEPAAIEVYTKSEINSLLDGKSNTGHTHTSSEITDLNTTLSNYYTKDETSGSTEISNALGTKANTSDLDNFFDDAKYEDSGTTKVINFYHENTIKATIDASDFIVDGMVESVSAVTSGNTTVLDIKWNTAAGGQETIVDIGDIFEADNYYTKSETSGATEISNALEGKVNTSDIVSAITPSNSGSTAPIATKVVAENELTVSSALNDLNGTLSAHTADTNIHLTSTEKTNLHAHSNKSYLDGITGTVGTMAYQNASSYSSATEVSTALSGKSNMGHTHDDRYYTESEINALVGSGYTNTTITDVIENMDQAVAAAITDLNDKIGDIESILATI